MTVFNTGEGGTAATNVTAGTSGGGSGTAFAVVSAAGTATIQWTSAQVWHGSLAYDFNVPDGDATVVDLTDGATTAATFAARVYLRIGSYPASTNAQFPLNVRNVNTSLARVEMSTTGTVRLVLNATTTSYSSTALSLNTWYRLELTGSGFGTASTAMTLNVYDGDTTTLILTLSLSGVTTALVVERIRFGKVATVAAQGLRAYFDDFGVAIGTSTELGPSVNPKAGSDSLVVAETQATLGYDDGSTEGMALGESGGTLNVTGLVGGGTGGSARDLIRAYVDWSGDGSFTGPLEDVTDLVRGGLRCSYGRAEPTATSPLTAGRGDMALDNRDRRFSRLNTASPLYGKIKPARQVRFERTVGGTTFTLFRAHTDSTPLNPDVDSKLVQLSLVDALADFRGVKVSTGLYRGIWSGQAIGYVLDAVGWTGPRNLDQGSTIFPFWWADDSDAFEMLSSIVASEGQPALLTMDTTGAVVFRDRQHRLVDPRSTTSQGTWRGRPDAPEPVMSRGFSYDDAWQNIVNDVVQQVDERQVTARAVVWQTDDVITLDPNEAQTFIVSTTDPFLDATAPRVDADFTVITGSVASVTLSRDSGTSTVITVRADDDGASISGLQLTALPVPVKRTYRVTSTDPVSAAPVTSGGYGSRGLPSGCEPVWAGRWDAKDILQLYTRDRAQPLPMLTVRFVCGVGDQDRLTRLLGYDLSDRVTVQEPESAVSGDYYIESISHEVLSSVEHVITFGLEAVPPNLPTPFVLGSSVLDSGVLTL